jgi:REP element-mobilizing transposase RayT
MARLRRLHVPGGIHYVILHSNEGREIFSDAADYESFTKLVERCVRRCRARVHAFCWTPREVHLAVQVSTIPLGRLVQRLAGQHARAMNRKLGQHGHLFQQRYWAVLLQQQTDLPEVVRHIHLTPLRGGLATDPAQYAHSSHNTYLGFAKIAWVTTGAVFRMMESPGRHRRQVYRQFIQDEADRVVAQLNQPDPAMNGRALDNAFLSKLMPRRRPNRDPVLLDRIINSVASKLDVPREAMLSPSRRRTLSLARALVAWHATRNDVATLTEVAQWFHRNPSTLCVGVERYRRTRHDLFDEPINQLLDSTPTPVTSPAPENPEQLPASS